MFGYASDETEDCMPLTHSMATRLGKKLTDVRKSGLLWWLRPDGKTQVTIQYLQREDGSVEPRKDSHRCYLHAACGAIEGHSSQGGGWVHGPGRDSPKHGGDEQTHRGGGREEDTGRDHIEKRKACLDSVRRPHAPSHQPIRQVHHRWSTG